MGGGGIFRIIGKCRVPVLQQLVAVLGHERQVQPPFRRVGTRIHDQFVRVRLEFIQYQFKGMYGGRAYINPQPPFGNRRHGKGECNGQPFNDTVLYFLYSSCRVVTLSLMFFTASLIINQLSSSMTIRLPSLEGQKRSWESLQQPSRHSRCRD
ncbi:hypothetical protein Barb6XT_02743 [Bacteroidales bacterium Barb6XT]|nr:hypothetical protein Barb6XT_02743 [Bacteroidales bacterium Barb6XT]